MKALLREIRSCEVCAEHLPKGPRPILQASPSAAIVIIGQAPGRKVHESGVPWQDPSGDRLRDWLEVSVADFYDPDKVALVPMGFCFPGSTKSGDKPPRPECAPLWHDRVLEQLPKDRLEIIIGAYAQKRYINDPGKNLTETVARWQEYLPGQIVIPHPSPRNKIWLKRNPWFETDALPLIRQRVAQVFS